MKKLTFFIVFICAKISFAQVITSLDSAKYLVQNYQYKSALAILNRVRPDSISRLECFYLKGLALKGEIKYREAIISFNDLVRYEPSNITALIELGSCYKILGDTRRAYSSFLKADSISPGIYVRTEMANILFSNEQYDLAADIYKNLLTKDSLNTFLLRSIGRCYDKMFSFDSAQMYFEKAIHINPYEFHTVYPLCNIYVRKKEYQEGIDISSKYLAFDSTDIQIKRMNAYLYLLKKDYKISLDLFKRYYENMDTSVFTIKYLGVSYFKLNIFDTAKIFLEEAFLKDTMDALTCNFLGISCAQSYWKKLGIDYLNRAIKLLSPDPVYISGVYTNLAEAYNGYYKYDDALDAFLKAFELNPGDTLLSYRIASQYDRWIKDKNLAIKYYKIFLRTRPKVPLNLPEGNNEKPVISYYSAAEARLRFLGKNQVK